ncbi:hypothetical protein AF6_2343 [Anoxybacillus flavithermus TNO-09.006]|nr:hypothetical protein AF6_2343 [Anoxybacillus flavithermus TNO-09.006]
MDLQAMSLERENFFLLLPLKNHDMFHRSYERFLSFFT